MARKKVDWIIGLILVCSLLIFIILFWVMIWGVSHPSGGVEAGAGTKVAVVDLIGVIYDSQNIVQQFEKYGKDKSVKAIVFHINSPGGGVAASQEIYWAAKAVRDAGKPIIVSMSSVAASGGYYAALGASKIMANPGTTTGSIGVLAEFPNFSGLMKKLGIDHTVIKSGEFKDTGNPYRKIDRRELEFLQEWIDDAYNQFLNTIALERKKSIKEIRPYADGRVFTGQQAVKYGLIDTLGTYRDAIKLAARLGGIKGEPKVYREQKKRRLTLFDLLFEDLSKFFPETHPNLKYQWL